MLDAHDIAMIVRRMIAYWLLILAVGGALAIAVRVYRRHRRGHRHRRRPRR